MNKNKIIWTNGCFDILHCGHIELFKFCKSLGTRLIVGLDCDERVKQSKGELRPINNLQDRIAMLNAICYIDGVVWFDSDEELENQIRFCGAEVIVVGDDYKNKNVIGSHLVDEVRFFKKLDGYSTTKIIQRSSDR